MGTGANDVGGQAEAAGSQGLVLPDVAQGAPVDFLSRYAEIDVATAAKRHQRFVFH
jgi:hypothetical protein